MLDTYILELLDKNKVDYRHTGREDILSVVIKGSDAIMSLNRKKGMVGYKFAGNTKWFYSSLPHVIRDCKKKCDCEKKNPDS